MTIQALYLWGKQELTKAELESPAFDAVCLLSPVFGLDRHGLILHGGRTAEWEEEQRYRTLIARRAAREPLQYILGTWPFMEMTFTVGPGVLVPREDTRTLVEEGIRLARALNRRRLVIFDLCAGSGAVTAGLVKSLPEADVWCFELSDDALPYLEKNLGRYAPDAHICRLDVLSALPADGVPIPDILLSNPPYIPTGELNSLSPEVQREPVQALDGGGDGLDFYRVIAKAWCALLEPGGYAAVEIGAGQREDVCALFTAEGLRIDRVLRDGNGLDRVVSVSQGRN